MHKHFQHQVVAKLYLRVKYTLECKTKTYSRFFCPGWHKKIYAARIIWMRVWCFMVGVWLHSCYLTVLHPLSHHTSCSTVLNEYDEHSRFKLHLLLVSYTDGAPCTAIQKSLLIYDTRHLLISCTRSFASIGYNFCHDVNVSSLTTCKLKIILLDATIYIGLGDIISSLCSIGVWYRVKL